MREFLFRAVSGVLFLLICYLAVGVIRAGIWPDLDDLLVMLSALVIGPTFGVFAVLGERAAYRVLIPGMALLHLPSILLEAILKRTVDLPEYLREGKEPDRLGESESSGDSS